MSDITYKIGDCRQLLKEVPDASVKLVVTSPPYNIDKPYGNYKDKIALNDWEDLIRDVTKEVYRILTPDGSFFLNLSPVPYGKDKEILPLPFIGYQIFKESGLHLRNMITWTFNNMQNCINRLSGRYENILWGVKDLNNYVFNLDDIRIPYITKNDKRLEGGAGRNPTDVWYFDRVNNMTKKKLGLQHPTVYPLQMIMRILKMSSNPGDTILDPFVGSGTSLVAAKLLDRNGIGFEIDEKYADEIEMRLKQEASYIQNMSDDLDCEDDCMLYEELLASCKDRFDDFFKNVPIFENQFTWSDFNAKCYDAMYTNNTYENIAEVKRIKESIPELKDVCKKCGDFYIPARNKSIPKYDVILGKQHEEALMKFLTSKLGAKTERADLQNRSLPDCKILKPDGSVAAYFEVKFHGAPFVKALNFTGRYCYEGSATLDYKKIQKQLELIDNNELNAPVFYVHWIEYPCLKGIFYETSEQVKEFLASGQEEFSRDIREGDKAKKSIYLKKKYSPLLNMSNFEAFLNELRRLIDS